MSTALEVMRAIVDNGGPIEAWVSQNGKDWVPAKIVGFDLESRGESILVETKHGLGIWYKFASIQDPNEKNEKDGRDVCPNCGEKAWKIALDKGMPGCANCRKPWHVPITEPKTRPMTAREFAWFVGENMGKYLYQVNEWPFNIWTILPDSLDDIKPEEWIYAHDVPGELYWEPLPQMEVE